MTIKTVTEADKLPHVDLLLVEDELTEQERLNFCFGEATDGTVYCLVNRDCSDILKKRAQTIRSFKIGARTIETMMVTKELLSIFRDQVRYSIDSALQSDSELDHKFNEILTQAIETGTSDIHIDIFPNRADIKFRIHGMVFKIAEMDARSMNLLMNYVYNVAAAEGSKDTQFNVEEMQDALLDRTIDVKGERKHFKLRLQTAPCYPNSITIVMRVLPIDSQIEVSITDLGYSEAQHAMLHRAQLKPTGATIIAGTTGSGKSTTIATLLSEIYQRTKGTKKILTTEDPPEYSIPGANQINLSAKKNVVMNNQSENLFVKSIKVAMRCDPDILMVGEVRDESSCNLLSSAVLSGHQVFTTVHASSALAIFDRMINMGFDRHVLTSPNFLSLLIYQTLLPKVCQKCSLPYDAFVAQGDLSEDDTMMLERVKEVFSAELYQQYQGPEGIKALRFVNAEGCDHCAHGYSGRTVACEMVEPTEDLLAYFKRDEFAEGLRYWKAHGGTSVLEHALSKVIAGQVDPRSAEMKCGMLTVDLNGSTSS